MTCAQAAPPRRMLRGLRAYKGVDAHIQGFACEQHTAIDTESAKVQTHCFKMTDFRLFSPNGSAVWRAHRLTSRPHHRQSGGIALHEGPTRRRHTPRRLHVVQNPQPPPVRRIPEGPEGTAAIPMGGGGAWPDNEATHRATSATRRHWCGGRRWDRRARLRCPWAAAGPGRASRSTTPSRRLACGDLAGGPPPTGTQSSPAP